MVLQISNLCKELPLALVQLLHLSLLILDFRLQGALLYKLGNRQKIYTGEAQQALTNAFRLSSKRP